MGGSHTWKQAARPHPEMHGTPIEGKRRARGLRDRSGPSYLPVDCGGAARPWLAQAARKRMNLPQQSHSCPVAELSPDPMDQAGTSPHAFRDLVSGKKK